jgi:hypothetical protein
MTEISAQARPLRKALHQSYVLEPYQRGYEWTATEVQDLLHDVLAAYRPRAGEVGAKGYFVGSVLTAGRGEKLHLVDGQQRLTTFALILIALRRIVHDRRRAKGLGLGGLFDARSRLTCANVLAEPRRQEAFQQLDRDGRLSGAETELERNLADRFSEIYAYLEARLRDREPTLFQDWLLDKVTIVEVNAGAGFDGFAASDAMSSRGQPQQGIERLRAFLESGIADPSLRAARISQFDEALARIANCGPGADREFVQSWLAARCVMVDGPPPAQPALARKSLSESLMRDIEDRGPFFAIDHAERRPELGLHDPADFIDRHWRVFADSFKQTRRARAAFDADVQGMRFLDHVGFDLDLYDEVLLLAGVMPGSDDWRPRVALCAQFLENLAARWAWTADAKGLTLRSIDRVKWIVAKAAGEVRGKSLQDMAHALASLQRQAGFDFTDARELSLPTKGASVGVVHALLARMAAYLEALNGDVAAYARLGPGAERQPHMIEHILSPTMPSPGRAMGHQFKKAEEYHAQRERLGALLILPSGLSQQLQDQPYAVKLSRYRDGGADVNLLARTLMGSEALPQNVARALAQKGVVFSPIEMVTKEALNARQSALVALAGIVWSEDRLLEGASLPQAQAA